MLRPSLPHPLHIFRVTEVIAVVEFAQPPLLTGLLAGGFTIWVGNSIFGGLDYGNQEQRLVAVQTFTANEGCFHRVEKPSLKRPTGRPQIGRKCGGDENGKRREEEILVERGEEDGSLKKQHFQIGVFTPFSDRR
jgi:hypothetical protein